MIVEAIYEMEMLRLLQPLKLAEGSKVEISIVPIEIYSFIL